MKIVCRFVSFLTAVLLFSGCSIPTPGPESTPGIPSAPETSASVPIPATVPSAEIPTEAVTETPSEVPTEAAPAPTDALPQPSTEPEQSVVSPLSLREKVGQLFLVDPDSLVSTGPVTELTDALQAVFSDYPVGGVILFYDNIADPDQLTALNAALSHCTRIPMFLAVDEEGGPVARVAAHETFDVPRYRSAAAVGADGNPDDAYHMGDSIGGYLSALGFNLDFAPVADVNTNPDNPIIGNRAFSSEPETAALLSHAFAEGLSDNGIIPVFKHFPGHGNTAEDSHSEIAVSHQTADALRSCEWLPYLDAFGCVMVGHIAVPEVLGDLTPATFSRELVTENLKTELGFEGLVITDSLSMGAVTDHYSPAEAALAALEAGCDILLMPEDLPAAFEGIIHAVESGALSQADLDRHVEKILQFKQEHGIWTGALPNS